MPTSPLSNISRHPRAPRLLQRITTSTTLLDDVELFQSVKRHLREPDDDQTVRDALFSALDEAERHCNRTLRLSVSRTIYYSHFRYLLPLPLPPTKSITSVKYYDPDGTLQTMSSADYSLLASTDSQAHIQWQADYTFPNLDTDRVDPVQVAIVCGYSSAEEVPALVKMAIRLLAEANFDGRPEVRDEAYRLLAHFVYRGYP